MSRLIDASELLEYLESCLQNGRPLSHLYDLSEIVRYVKSMPTIDAVEVVHGEWIWEDSVCNPRICSVCKQKFYIGRGWNYCPNCGAKMDGKKKHE